ncbi:MAG TPA: ATP-binding protein, partial [Chryseolinea sp.]
EQAYTRFQDLQRAEAQAREAQIESSLERVRSKTMAMHNSEDVSIATNTMFNEIAQLGVESMRCGIGILHENQEMEVWTSAVTNEGHSMKGVGTLNVNLHPLWLQVYKGWKKNDGVFFYHLAGEDLKAYYRALTSMASYSAPYITSELPEHNCYGFYFPDGAVFTFNYQDYSEEHLAIWKRFASVFSLTYRRYKDLKNAEAQAREAQIEAALERVRAKAMAMHSTADLTATVSTIFIELRNLGIKPLRFGLGIIERDTRNAALYSASVSGDGGDLQLLGWVVLDDHPILKKIYDGWVARTDGYFPVLKGDELKTYYEKLRPGFKTPDWHADYEQYGQFYYFEEGSLYAWSENPIAPSEIPIFKRFTSVLALTYKRYNDLQLSEANARDAVRRSSIDRVRAEIASMRTTGDLERITPLIWNELTKLGVPFIRCGVFIMDNHAEIIHTFLSTPDGKAIGSFNLPYTTPGNIQKALSHWKQNEIYIDHWTEEVFRQFADTLVTQGALPSPDQYLSTIPHGGFYLHFLPFPQGMLYVGNTDELQKDHLQLIQAVTDAFSAAYTRYEDFVKLEAAKQQVDKTLADLKVTQNQLVQSEKMASLGELTAGIAHEIQNPLNFVNNFSEVSNELIDEMVEEVNKGNFDEAKAIAIDVKNNLDKINHHGKRADGIVKNMLQHSQSGSGQKELTDINQLCDEYIRLSYHGLRAKDKSFNAKIETYFDPTLDKINVIPQEIGRVVLNLVNNAFYAANEKMNNNIPGFQPKISVTTKKHSARADDPVGRAKIEISVRDNGAGIPQKVLDKIFQPFFTTKPTGQGTGLGLSLSYDIVKVHNGELKVETKEGEGSKFDVLLPV